MYYHTALENTFLSLDEELKNKEYSKGTGTTSCVVLITEDKIFCANAGDSRAVLNKSDR